VVIKINREYLRIILIKNVIINISSSLVIIICVSAGTVKPIVQRATGWTARVRLPAGVRDFSLVHNVQTDYGVHPISYLSGTGAKAAGT
jgi:hypothetical protein